MDLFGCNLFAWQTFDTSGMLFVPGLLGICCRPGIPRVFSRPCISQPRKGEAPSSINGLKRPEVSLETL